MLILKPWKGLLPKRYSLNVIINVEQACSNCKEQEFLIIQRSAYNTTWLYYSSG